MAALPLDVEPEHRPSTRACGQCLHALHGPVAFCPYCGQAAGSAQVPVMRTHPPAPVPVLVSPSPPLDIGTVVLAPDGGGSPPSAPRPGDPQAAARRLVTGLTVLVVALAAVIAYLAFFGAPTEPAVTQAPVRPPQASDAQAPSTAPTPAPAPAPSSPASATVEAAPPLVPLVPARVRAPSGASSPPADTAPPATPPSPVAAAAPAPAQPEPAAAAPPASAPEPPPGSEASSSAPGVPDTAPAPTAPPAPSCPGALAALSLCAPPGR